MAYIGKTPTVGNFQKCDAISVVNGQAAYTLQVGGSNVSPESPNHVLVSLNGILQAPTDSYTISGSTLTFASNLATGDVIDFVMLLGNVLDLGTPSDNTVTGAKLNNDVISAQTALASEPADTDEFLVSDAGTIKRIDYSLIKGGGEWTKILHQTASDDANVAFNSTYITSTYQDYKIVWSNVHAATDGVRFNLHISEDNGSSFQSMDFSNQGFKEDGNVANLDSGANSPDTEMDLMNDENMGNDTGETHNGDVTLFDPSATDNKMLVLGRFGYQVDNSYYNGGFLGGCSNGTAAVNYVKFQMSSGNITTGEFTLYGRKIT